MQVRIRRFALLPTFAASLAAQDFHDLAGASLAPVSGSDWTAVAVGDVDGDGDLDQVFACFGAAGSGDRSFWLRNNGSGYFERMPDTALQLAPALSRDVVLADFDGDGDLDAFFANQLQDSLCLNDGTGVLALSLGALPAINRTSYAAAAGDIDSDGDTDIVCACGGYDVVYRNNGSGTFVESTSSLPLVWDDTRAIDLADYDGDGDLDLLRINADAPSELLRNDGSGVFTVAGSTVSSGIRVSSGDVDGDGDRDFVLATFGNSFPIGNFYGSELYLNDGAGSFVSQTLLPNPAFYLPQLPELLDADSDGDLDCAIAGEAVQFNDGGGNFTPGAAQPLLGLHFADFDADGDLDQIGEPTLRNDGAGTFEVPLLDAFAAFVDYRAVAFGDFDGDGDPDVVTEDFDGSWTIRVYANDGHGRFDDLLTQTPMQVGGPAYFAFDWNADGFDDLVQRYGGLVWTSTGASLIPDSLPVAMSQTVMMDVDGDQDLDFVGTVVGTPTWVENVAGSVGSASTIPVPTIWRVHAAADLDGDGRQDLIYDLPSAGGSAWARCTGAAAFTPQPVLPAASEAYAAAAADLDGDGDLDVVLGHNNQFGTMPQVTVLENDGTGQFSVAATALTSEDLKRVAELRLFDADDDGDLDILAQAGIGGSARLLRNDGLLQFVDATGSGEAWNGIELPTQARVAIADVDLDGDIDVAAGNSLQTNLTRQLLAYENPVIGTTWRLDIVQRPVGSSIGAVVIGLAELDPGLATPFGNLRVDPLAAVLSSAVPVLQPEPVEVWSLPLPGDPALQGTELFAQHVAVTAGGIVLGSQIAVEVR